ncbi:FIG00553353: hypothetical protein [Cronobacter turicensis 564]|nr:FIG00553353: hypothetical protein [Cronobacter turicensis 564]
MVRVPAIVDLLPLKINNPVDVNGPQALLKNAFKINRADVL